MTARPYLPLAHQVPTKVWTQRQSIGRQIALIRLPHSSLFLKESAQIRIKVLLITTPDWMINCPHSIVATKSFPKGIDSNKDKSPLFNPNHYDVSIVSMIGAQCVMSHAGFAVLTKHWRNVRLILFHPVCQRMYIRMGQMVD